MDKIFRLLKFLLIFIPVTILNGIRMVIFEDVCIDEIFFEISKPKRNNRKISKSIKKRIVKEYLNDCWNKSLD